LTVASLAAHIAFVAGADFIVGDTKGQAFEQDEPIAVVNIQFSCEADASLAFSARSLACTVPGIRKAGCQAKVSSDLQFDLLLCQGLEEDPPEAREAVAFMSEAEIEALEALPMLDVPPIEQIEAAQLLQEEIAQKAEQAEKRISDPRPNGQVVEITKPQVETVPTNARFLSEYDVQVEEQTVARGSTEEMVAAPSPKEIPVAEEATELPEELPDQIAKTETEPQEVAKMDPQFPEGSSEEETLKNATESPLLAMRAQTAREELTICEESGTDAVEANGLAAAKGNSSEAQKGREHREWQERASGPTGLHRRSLQPSQEILSRLAGGGSVDRLDGVKSGEFTALSSKKWKFASFFNRMKRQVAQNWHPDTVYIRRDPTGKVYGTKDRVTVLEVSLKPNGQLAKVVVAKQSGVSFLDDEAIHAFELAQPFPNPPTGLVDSGSQLITFSFGFQFQVGQRRDSWQIFRYQ
jgi:TonB family protein